MRISVAICTWNRSCLLDRTLSEMQSLRLPTGVEWELLIVNNNCTDDTDGVIDNHIRELPIRRLFEPRMGLSNARNCAISAATGDLILWTDDDVLVSEGWLAALVDAARRHPEASGFGGPVDPWFPLAPDPDLVEAFPTLKFGFCGLDLGLPEGPLPESAQLTGANMAHRVQAIKDFRFNPKLGRTPLGKSVGYMAHGAHDDSDFNGRLRTLGFKFIWVPGMRLQHYVDPKRMTLNYLKTHYFEDAKTLVYCYGIPPGIRLFGIPRWMIRSWIEQYLSEIAARLTGRRRAALSALGNRKKYAGMISACRELRVVSHAR